MDFEKEYLKFGLEPRPLPKNYSPESYGKYLSRRMPHKNGVIHVSDHSLPYESSDKADETVKK